MYINAYRLATIHRQKIADEKTDNELDLGTESWR
jgi:hypothetical protein